MHICILYERVSVSAIASLRRESHDDNLQVTAASAARKQDRACSVLWVALASCCSKAMHLHASDMLL
jgi:hypothetical protein